MGDQKLNLRLAVRHTFLHVVDIDTDALKLRRSKSDSSVSTHATIRKSEDTLPSTSSSSVNSSSGSDQSSLASSPQSDSPRTLEPPEEAFERKPAGITDQRSSTSAWPLGAEYHHIGQCQPCVWNTKRTGCKNGEECKFCHMCTNEDLKALRKARKQHYQRAVFKQAGQASPVLGVPADEEHMQHGRPRQTRARTKRALP